MKYPSTKTAGLRSVLTALLLSLLLLSCATGRSGSLAGPPVKPDSAGEGSLSPVQRDLVESAGWALGQSRLKVKDRNFNLDCSGVVLAIYYRAGIDLTSSLGGYSGGGVQRLYSYLMDHNLLYLPARPVPGDLLFWDNTYDKNSDGRQNDELTHVGMVVSVNREGTVEYIHHNYRKGIVLASMNLLDPDNLAVNSPMRMKSSEPGHAPRWLSSHLLRDAGRAYELTEID